MTAIITANNVRSRDNVAPAPSLKDDGTNYIWRMFFENNRKVADADTVAELIDVLIPGYAGLVSAEDRLQARIVKAKEVQRLARATILANLTPEEAEKIADWEWDVLSFGSEDVNDPFGWGDGTGTLGKNDIDVIDFWSNDKPLVLLETSYKPFTDVASPMSHEGDYTFVSNIIWLRVQSQEDFLRSLSRIGYIAFGTPAAPYREDPKAR